MDADWGLFMVFLLAGGVAAWTLTLLAWFIRRGRDRDARPRPDRSPAEPDRRLPRAA